MSNIHYMKKVVFWAFAALLALSCQRELAEQPGNEPLGEAEFYASIEAPGNAGTKVFADEDMKVLWNADDRIVVFKKTTLGQQYRFTGADGANAGGFTLVPDPDPDEFTTGNDLDYNYAVYPYDESMTISNAGVLNVTLPARQVYQKNSFGVNSNTMVSVVSNKNLLFKNAGGFVALKLYGKNIKVSSIKLEGNNHEKLAGAAKISMAEGGVPATTMQKNATESITLVCTTPVALGKTEADYTEFWFVVPPTNFTQGFTVTVTEEGGETFTQSVNTGIDVARNSLMRMAAVEVVMPGIAVPVEINIDGDFSDWTSLPIGSFYKVVNDPDSPWPGVREMRCVVTEETVYYYVKFDQDALEEAKNAETPSMPIRLCFNTDGEFTSGYSSYFLDSYDFIIEGSIIQDGAFRKYNGTLYQRFSGWTSLGGDLTSGAGSGVEYEISMDRALFNQYANTSETPKPMGDEFQTGICFYFNGYSSIFSVIPNQGSGDGYAHLLNVEVGGGNGDDPTADPYAHAAPEVRDGDTVVACDANVNQFLTDIQYPTHDYTYTSLLTWAEENNVAVSPGESDRAAEYSIRWTPYTSTSDAIITVSEPTRDWEYTASVEDGYVNITNLLPNTHYYYTVEADGGTLAYGEFDTVGKVHQLRLRSRIRNCRDLGGWKTTDGRTVKYRKVYRGGRLEPSYLDKTGKKALLTEGIKAQLDLRGQADVLAESTLKGLVDDYAFCAPVIEEGYSQMLQNDKEKTRQCIQFIMDCVDAGKPVYFHCSLGRDRTGTVAMITLGILGVPEGDISQEYEITQFAPNGYATSTGEQTKMTRMVDYRGAANVIWSYAGNGSFQDGMNAYLLEIGISQADIDKFKANMLD